jgi:radial spoke head protein 9
LNDATETDFDELLFWGRITAKNCDYYIAMAMCYKDRYEFPEKKFFWCTSANGFKFTAFPKMEDQHTDCINKLASTLFEGEPMKVLEQRENPEEEAEKKKKA